MPNEKIYKTDPLRWVEHGALRIPVFSNVDSYIENYDRISSDHLSHLDCTGHNPFIPEDLWQESESNTVELVRKHTSSGKRVLDVGCGTGRLLSMLPEFDRYGLDISAGYLQRAAQTGACVCLSKIEDMPYVDELFDTVVCTDVLEHVFDLHLAVTHLFRVVKPEGCMVIRVPYKEDLSCYLDPDFPYALAHLRTFDEQHLRLLMERIFPGHIVEERLGPYLVGAEYLKCPIKSRLLGGGLRLVMRIIGNLSASLRNRIVRQLFNPVEINIVVTKSKAVAA